MSARAARTPGAGRRSGASSPAEPLRRSQRRSEPGPPSPGALGPAPPGKQPPATPKVGVGKIVLRKIVAPAAQSPPGPTPRRSPRLAVLSEKENHPPGPEPTWEDLFRPCSALGTPAPILGTDSAPRARDPDLRDLEMSKKVRRSYSRLGSPTTTSTPGATATSTPGAAGRPSCFGFEGLLAAEEMPRVSPVACSKATEVLQAPEEPWVPDTLPGISPIVAREKRKKKKPPGILKSELDEWAAAMNAEFAAAEKFDLLIE